MDFGIISFLVQVYIILVLFIPKRIIIIFSCAQKSLIMTRRTRTHYTRVRHDVRNV